MNEKIEILEVTSAGKHDPEFVAEAMRLADKYADAHSNIACFGSGKARAALQAHLEGR